MSDIIWPAGFVPGFTDHFASNEVIVAGLATVDVWPLLDRPERWSSYYGNATNVQLHDGAGPSLSRGVRFFFETFGFPIEAEVVEHVPPIEGQPARVAWHGWSADDANDLDVHHAWLIEDLAGGRVRILTQESQNGPAARDMANTKPHAMIDGHQDWLNGLVDAARKQKSA